MKERRMICTCTHCQARYQLEADKVPQRIIKVRCPACSGVFSLDGTQREETVAAPAFEDSFETSASPFSAPQPGVAQADPFAVTGNTPEATPEPGTVDFEAPASPLSSPSNPASECDISDTPAAASITGEYEIPADDGPAMGDGFADSGDPAGQPESSPAAATVATLGEAPRNGTRRRRCKEEMLARALVSDILVYNRDTRDSALAEGNLLEALGGEIKKSWELYKEKVTPEVANSTTYFREALNEILAEGNSVF
jgi:predicted Zn finger-like uncharacterized protein